MHPAQDDSARALADEWAAEYWREFSTDLGDPEAYLDRLRTLVEASPPGGPARAAYTILIEGLDSADSNQVRHQP